MTLPDTKVRDTLLSAARRGAKQRRLRRRARAGSVAAALLLGALILFTDRSAPTPEFQPQPTRVADARIVSVKTPTLAQVVRSRSVPSNWIVTNSDHSERRLTDNDLLVELEKVGHTRGYIRTPERVLVAGLE